MHPGARSGMVQSVPNPAIVADTKAFLTFVDMQPSVRGPWIGTVGYCMGVRCR
jgi:dienelactone hydrolase